MFISSIPKICHVHNGLLFFHIRALNETEFIQQITLGTFIHNIISILYK